MLVNTGGGVALIGTTTFRLPQGNLTTQGLTTVPEIFRVTEAAI